MKAIDFTIEEDDLKCLYLACKFNNSFSQFVKECKEGYTLYYKRNSENISKYGNPKTFSQWVNGQTIALTYVL